MTKKSKSILNFVFAFIFVLSAILSLSTLMHSDRLATAENQVSYKKKIVSVLYDNSGSMRGANDPLARYSLQILANLLNEQDELYVNPMNTHAPFQIDLSLEKRQQEIKNKVIENSKLLTIYGTPISSIRDTVDVLKSKGMKTAEELGNQTLNVEYWLVILTDGEFDEFIRTGGYDTVGCANQIAQYIDGYAGLNTIYLGFGSAADLSKTQLAEKYPFSSFVANQTNLPTKMAEVANKISGRYGATADSYSVSYDKSAGTSKVVIDLDKYQFAMSSVSVLVQNCGATLKKVTYNGKTLNPEQSFEMPTDFLKEQYSAFFSTDGGYVTVVKDSERFSGGKIELTYDKEVKSQNISVLLEPAIYIDAYLEYNNGTKWERTDLQYINSNMYPGDEIRVQYKVYSADGVEVDTKAIFGPHDEKVTYCGEGYQIGQSIKLKEGSNEIFVSVSVLDGGFSMYSSLLCYIEKDPSYYRVTPEFKQGTGNDYKKAQVDFTVYTNNLAVNKQTLDSKYTWTVTCIAPDGSEIDTTNAYVTSTGKIHYDFDGSNIGFGEYSVTCVVVNNENKVSRKAVQKIELVPREIKVNCLTTDSFSVTAYRLGAVTKTVEYQVILDGITESFENDIIDYKVELGGKDVTDKCSIDNGKLIFVIDKPNVQDTSIGEKQLKVTVSTLGNKSDNATYKFNIVDSVYVVEKLDKGASEIDRYDISSAGAAAYFTVYKDEQPLTIEEINAAMQSGELKVDTNPAGWVTLLPANVQITVENIDGKATVCCRITSDIISPFDNLLGSFIFANQKDITLVYNTASATKTIDITPVSMTSRIVRWVIIFLIIMFILHVLLFLLGFIIAKPLPRGVMLKFKVDAETPGEDVGKVSAKPLNMKNERLLWHLSRFIPFRELANQKPQSREEMLFEVNKKTRTVSVKAKCRPKVVLVEYIDNIISNKEGTEVLKILDFYKKGGAGNKKLEIKNRAFMRFFRKSPAAPIRAGEKLGSYTTWYGVHKLTDDKKLGELTGYRVFVPKRK